MKQFYDHLQVDTRADALRVLAMEWKIHNELQQQREEHEDSARVWLEDTTGNETLDGLGRLVADAMEEGTALQIQNDAVEIRAWELLLDYVRLENEVMELSIQEHVKVLWETAERIWDKQEPARIRLCTKNIMKLMLESCLDKVSREREQSQQVT